MKRRGFIALTATIPLAGCGMLGGGGGVSASLDATSGSFEDAVSAPFEASAGDEYEVTVEAGSEGAEVGLVPEQSSADESDVMGGHQIGWSWSVEPNGETTETVEIDEENTYVFMIIQGTADVEAA